MVDSTSEESRHSVLCVCTSASMTPWGSPTGLWLEELAIPYYTFKDAGYTIKVCTVSGGPPVIDPAAIRLANVNETTAKFLADREAQVIVDNASSLAICLTDGTLNDVACIYLCGGHGCIADFFSNKDITQAVERVYCDAGGCVASICHGILGLIECKVVVPTKNVEKSLLDGKFVAAFSDEEEERLGLLEKIPISKRAEQLVDRAGAICVPAAPWKANVVVDGRLITAQNPQSSLELGLRVLDVLRSMGKRFSPPENVNKPWGA